MAVRGRDQNKICFVAEKILCCHLVISPLAKVSARSGKDAIAYDSPMIPTGVVSRFIEKLNTETAPVPTFEASATITRSDKLFIERPIVLGSDKLMSFRSEAFSMRRVRDGVKPAEINVGIWISK